MSRLCGYLATLSPLPLSDAFFFMAVDARVAEELGSLQKQPFTAAGEAQGALQRLAEGLHAFAHPALKNQMAFLRSEAFASLLRRLLAKAQGAQPSDETLGRRVFSEFCNSELQHPPTSVPSCSRCSSRGFAETFASLLRHPGWVEAVLKAFCPGLPQRLLSLSLCVFLSRRFWQR